MPKAIYGKKVCMTRYFESTGREVPVTAIQAGPCPVVQVKSEETDGYRAIQVGFEAYNRKKGLVKPLTGHFKKSGVAAMRFLREIRLKEGEEYKTGDVLQADQFAEGDWVDVIGVTKGHGFQGGVRRHNWAGGRASHGSMFHRAPGSIGASSYPSRVIKGKRLPGRMGNDTMTVQGLKVVKVDAENNMLYVKGSVPGANGGLLLVRTSVKNKKK